MNSRPKKMAVICAAYQMQNSIMDMVESFRAQTPLDGWEYELRIGVDACHDTAMVLTLAGVDFEWSAENVGAYQIRNGLMQKHADAYGIFDPDDLMLPDYLSTLIPLAEKHGIAASGKQVITCGSVVGYQPFGGGQSVFRHDVLDAVGGFQPHRYSGDWDLTARAMIAGYQICLVNSPLWVYRRSESCATMAPETKCGSPLRLSIDAQNDIYRMTRGCTVDHECAKFSEYVPLGADRRVSAVVITPGAKDAHRAAVWQYLQDTYYRAVDVDEIVTVNVESLYNKGAAFRQGVEASTGDIMILADADVCIDRRVLSRAVSMVRAGMDWVSPNTDLVRIDQEGTDHILHGGIVANGHIEKGYRGQIAGGLIVVSRDCWDRSGGINAGFRAWGGEDTAFGYVLQRDFNGVSLPGVLYHLWHPPQSGCVDGRDVIADPESMQLLSDYRAVQKSGGEWPANQYDPAEWEGKFEITVTKHGEPRNDDTASIEPDQGGRSEPATGKRDRRGQRDGAAVDQPETSGTDAGKRSKSRSRSGSRPAAGSKRKTAKNEE